MTKFMKYPFAIVGDKTAIDETTQPSGVVSYEEGFGIDYQKDLEAPDPEARAFPRYRFNQLMFDITENIQQYQIEGFPHFITTADNLGTPYPYTINAFVRYDAGSGEELYVSKENSNTTLPTDATKWRKVDFTKPEKPLGDIMWNCGLTQTDPSYVKANGAAISRTTYADFFAHVTFTQNGTTTDLSTTVTGLTDTSDMYVGMAVTGSGVPSGTTIATIVSGTSITLSAAATASATVSLRFYLYGAGDESTTFNIPDLRGRSAIGQGAGSGLTAIKTGQRLGTETQALSAGNNGPHTHGFTNTGGGGGGSTGLYLIANPPSKNAATGTGITVPEVNVGNIPIVTDSQGSGTPFSIRNPMLGLTPWVKIVL